MYTDKKMRIFALKEILEQETDEDHGITLNRIQELLENWQYYDVDRKSIYADIDRLNDADLLEIERPSRGGNDNEYRVLSREFSLQEVKFLVDSVQASKFLSEQKSKDLITKLEKLCSRYEANTLNRQMLVANRVKQTNERVYHNIDAIQRAISANKQITFKYFEYALDKNNRKIRQYRSGGKPYFVSPWCMAYTDDNYYLLAYYAKYGEIRNYRIDRMEAVESLELDREGQDQFSQIDKTQYTKYTFAMYHGENKKVSLRFEHKLLNATLDRFGSEVMAYAADENHYQMTVTVAVSPQFFGWVTGMGTQMEIIGPDDVVEEYKKFLSGLLDQYK